MADALLSPFLDQLVTAIREMVEHEVRLVKGVHDAVENMSRNLEAIKAVLKDAEKRQWKDEAVKVWMDELKDVTYDMDDVLDEWRTMIEKDNDGKNDIETDRNASVVNKIKVCLSVLCRCFNSCPLGRQVHHRLDIARKIERLNIRLDSIGSRKDRFNFTSVSSSTSETHEPRRPNFSTSVIDVPVVYGQDKYKETVLNHLICGIGDESTLDQNLHIIPVVGMGGIGKTTLAKEVFNDQRVKENFSVRAWVCVSEPFDRFEIAKAIVQQLSSDNHERTSNSTSVGDHNWETLMNKFVASIKDKKFLIVLDDVWTDDHQEWGPLENDLKLGAVGSRVLVTTRKKEVAKMVGRQTHIVCMEGLSKEDDWLLFKEIAFFEKHEKEREDLKPIGEKIVSKCQGLPLAVKTLASLLRNKSREEWQHVLQSDLWDLEEVKLEKVKKNLLSHLLLSYYDLPSKEKRCFSYCAIFPKDFAIDVNDLIKQWMAQGYFGLKNHSMEAEGRKCFENLAMRSLFQDFEYNFDGSIKRCKMHDIVHDFVQFLTLNEFSTLNIAQKEDLMIGSARHLSLVLPSCLNGKILAGSISKKNLRTLVVRSSTIGIICPDLVLYLRCLRTLSLSGCSLRDLPKNIDELILLRYLDLSNNYLSVLPSTIGNLYNLQTLMLHDCGAQVSCSLPKEIGKLGNLRMLSLDFGSINHSDKFQVQDLDKLNNLRNLVMYRMEEPEHMVRPMLNENQNLYSLVLFFIPLELTCHYPVPYDESKLAAIQPHSNLQYLHVKFYDGHRGPSWLNRLTNLRSLRLEFCKSPEILHALGKLQSLETLELCGLLDIHKVGPEFLGVEIENSMSTTTITSTTGRGDDGGATTVNLFPKLKRILFNLPECHEWMGIPGWSVDSHVRIMPCLEYLKLQDCRYLKALPDFLQTTPLKHLLIEDCPKLDECCRDQSGKEWTKIQHVPDIQFL